MGHTKQLRPSSQPLEYFRAGEAEICLDPPTKGGLWHTRDQFCKKLCKMGHTKQLRPSSRPVEYFRAGEAEIWEKLSTRLAHGAHHARRAPYAPARNAADSRVSIRRRALKMQADRLTGIKAEQEMK
jgi:hypothetical protein